MTYPYCEPPIEMTREERELRRDQARWVARNITRKDRESLQAFGCLMSDLAKDIELAESALRAESGGIITGNVLGGGDQEFSPEDHRDRLERLFGVPMPGLLYARCDRPLTHEADRLRRIVAEHGIDYVVYDSIVFACDGPPESAEVAAAYFRAVRQVGKGSLHTAHTTKGENADKKPFGSAFWSNGARRVFYVKPSDQISVSSLTIGLFDRKRNVGPQSSAIGFHISFERERTVYTPVDIRDVQDLSAELPLWRRIQNAVKTGPLTLADLADDLSAKVDSVEKAVKRKTNVFTRVDGTDGVQRVALLARDDEGDTLRTG